MFSDLIHEPHTKLPLRYCEALVGHAIVDPQRVDLLHLPWGLVLPDKARRALGRGDVLVLSLREDPGLLARCHPFVQLGPPSCRLVARLSHVALRPEVIPLMEDFRIEPSDSKRLTIVGIFNQIKRVLFMNSNRVDCRSSNLREVTFEAPLEIENA